MVQRLILSKVAWRDRCRLTGRDLELSARVQGVCGDWHGSNAFQSRHVQIQQLSLVGFKGHFIHEPRAVTMKL